MPLLIYISLELNSLQLIKDEHKQPLSFISKLLLRLHHLSALVAARKREISTWRRGSGAEAAGAPCEQWVTSRNQLSAAASPSCTVIA